MPLALWVDGLPADAGAAAARGGFFLGLLYYGVLFYWMVVALIWFTPLAIAAWAASVLILAALLAGAVWAMHRMVHRAGVPLWLTLPVGWTAAEWFRGHWADVSFPWLGLGHALTGFPEWVGIAELVGGRGVTFWLALVSGIVAAGIVAWRRGRPPLREAAVVVAVVAAPVAWGHVRAGDIEERMRPALDVAVVQPDIPEHIKLDAGSAIDSTLTSLSNLMPEVEPGSVDLVIWPEVSFPTHVALPEQDVAGDWRNRFYERPELAELVRGFSRRARAPILFGALGFRSREDGRTDRFNSAFLMGPDGLSDFHYGKHFLVPVVERVPFANPEIFGDRFRYFGSYVPGPAWSVGEVAGASFGVLVCYESAFPTAARELRLRGADVLVNITNDAWYGREPWYARTTALWQHPAHLVMRAIEHRVGIARSANTGISMLVDPVGRISEVTPLFEATLRTGTVHTTEGLTLYTRLGDVAGTGAFAATLLLLAWGRRRRRESAGG